MPSLDIVSEIDLVEVRNAVDNANRELSTRFDFRGVQASFSFADEIVTLKAEGDFQIKQMMDMLRTSCAKRGVNNASLDPQEIDISGKTYKRAVKFKQGIEQPVAKKLIKLIKDAKLKVQAQIQADQVRVTGKKRDDLQKVIALAKDSDIDQPLQFTNFRD
ncbi:YajQ family cyclic di-GMP-binding protein [Paraglaciecola aquimarina]|uniref:Nucleotide-binding protein RS130_04875 n=1 Tax=Paraglaciecola aquimarina TaxID=1235557 RepID=A0ABU3STR3_9ALTE|nr:YajQ family cyclic di-GMP-binding protein [Paraglaciecola aquimarina]MDU0353352.1 YajQ family cyclic di-GMP-binding protein [Paraglaciecola aquimarina]